MKRKFKKSGKSKIHGLKKKVSKKAPRNYYVGGRVI